MLPMIAIYAYTWFNPLGYMDEESPHYLWNKEKVNSEETCYYVQYTAYRKRAFCLESCSITLILHSLNML